MYDLFFMIQKSTSQFSNLVIPLYIIFFILENKQKFLLVFYFNTLLCTLFSTPFALFNFTNKNSLHFFIHLLNMMCKSLIEKKVLKKKIERVFYDENRNFDQK